MFAVKRWNLLDVAMVAILGLIAAVGVAGYRRFQAPMPEISSVTPARVVAGAARQLSLHGRYLHPYVRAFVFEAGHALPIDAIDPAKQEAKAVTTTATRLDVRLPPVPPGVYDVYLFDEFQQVAFAAKAFTVVEPTYPHGEMTATIRFFLDAGPGPTIAIGDRDRSTPRDSDAPRTEGAVVTAVRVDPSERQALEMWVASNGPGDGAIWMGGRGKRQQLDLDLRVPLALDASGDWRYNGAMLRAGQFLDFESGRFKGRGMVIWVSDPHPLDTEAPHP